jgi:3-isopropylmalate/(R)-2-methylmalate dehydratase small subunit
MEKFIRLSAIAAPMPRDNVDTDTIIPVSHMKSLQADYGRSLFANERYHPDGSENPAFILNRPEYRSTQILVTGDNFGCGSSREHAVWALLGFGIRCVIAEGFGDIFYNNAYRTGLLPVVLPADDCRALCAAVAQSTGRQQTTVDLKSQEIVGPDGKTRLFHMEPHARQTLMEGLDAIGITLLHEADICAFRRHDAERRPWAYHLPR